MTSSFMPPPPPFVQVSDTRMNQDSSRSHQVVRIFVESRPAHWGGGAAAGGIGGKGGGFTGKVHSLPLSQAGRCPDCPLASHLTLPHCHTVRGGGVGRIPDWWHRGCCTVPAPGHHGGPPRPRHHLRDQPGGPGGL